MHFPRSLPPPAALLLPFCFACFLSPVVAGVVEPLEWQVVAEPAEIGVEEIRLSQGAKVFSTTPAGQDLRYTFDLTTVEPGAKPWNTIRFIFDYQDDKNYRALFWNNFGELDVIEEKEGKHTSLFHAGGRGQAKNCNRIEISFTDGKFVISANFSPVATIPGLCDKPGKFGFFGGGANAGTAGLHAPESLPVGKIRLSSFVGENAVLQRGQPVHLEGTADPGVTLTVTLNGQRMQTVPDSGGKWSVELPAMEAGGPYNLEIGDGKTALSTGNILIGDIWVCSGQSNMARTVSESDGMDRLPGISHDSRLRFYPVGVGHAAEPLHEPSPPAHWYEDTPSASQHASAVAYCFARGLRVAEDNVPIGLLISAVGGSPIEAWLPASTREQIAKDNGFSYPAKYLEQTTKSKDPASSLYNAMIAPFTRFPIRGFVWYQGEANSWQAWHYQFLLEGLIRDWRQNWREPAAPFLVVQLSAYQGKKPEGARSWAEMREVQTHVAEKMKPSAVVVSMDHGDKNDIHPARKLPIGERLAAAAHRLGQGESFVLAGPKLRETRIEENRVVLTFDPGEGALTVAGGGKLLGFELSDETGDFHPAEASLKDGRTVVVECEDVPTPKFVRYGWRDYIENTLANTAGFPATEFRTDRFPISGIGTAF